MAPAGDRGVGGDGEQRRQPGPQPRQHLDARSREGTPTCTWQPPSAGLGHHRTVPAGQLLVTGLAGSRRPARASGTARPRRPPGGSPQMPRRPRRAAAAGSARRRVSSRPVHTLVPVSTWNRISSCCDPRLPVEQPHQLGGPRRSAGGRVQEHELLLYPQRDGAGRAHRPRPAAGHRRATSRTGRSGHHHETCCSGGGRSGSRGPRALAGRRLRGLRGSAATAARPA